AEERERRGGIRKGKKVTQCFNINIAGDAGIVQECLNFGRKEKLPPEERVVNRLFPEPIPRQEQAAAVVVPQRESEHSIQARDAIDTELLIEMNNAFGVRVRVEAMSPGEKRGTMLLVIVNLPIERYPNRAVLIGHRLTARMAEVDNAQAPVSQHNAMI